MLLLLIGKLTIRITDDSKNKRVVVVQEASTLALVAKELGMASRRKEGSHESVLGRGIVDEREVEVTEGHFKVMSRLVFFSKAKGVVRRSWCSVAGKDSGLTGCVFVSESIVLVEDV
ncbi:hypothetical protein HG530_000022 [Fusarium avenaceum]|nr:hypothetical protein HG530_000022 [Fusarium avenaceum]